MKADKLDAALKRRRASLAKLTHEIRQFEIALVKAREAEAAEQRRLKEPMPVRAGTEAIKVWPGGIGLADRVRLKRWDGRGVCYDYLEMTGDEEEDRWRRNGCCDHTSPTFLQPHAAAEWNRLAKRMNKLLDKERIRLEGGPAHE
jgi:hypothetical protein